MTRRQRAATAELEGETQWNSGCGIDFSPDGIRKAQRNEACLRTIMDLLEAITEKRPWFIVEGADLEVQQLYEQWGALQFHDGVLYRNLLAVDG